MNVTDLKISVALGEVSSRQFKADVRKSDSLASEMAAFANSNGRDLVGSRLQISKFCGWER